MGNEIPVSFLPQSTSIQRNATYVDAGDKGNYSHSIDNDLEANETYRLSCAQSPVDCVMAYQIFSQNGYAIKNVDQIDLATFILMNDASKTLELLKIKYGDGEKLLPAVGELIKIIVKAENDYDLKSRSLQLLGLVAKSIPQDRLSKYLLDNYNSGVIIKDNISKYPQTAAAIMVEIGPAAVNIGENYCRDNLYDPLKQQALFDEIVKFKEKALPFIGACFEKYFAVSSRSNLRIALRTQGGDDLSWALPIARKLLLAIPEMRAGGSMDEGIKEYYGEQAPLIILMGQGYFRELDKYAAECDGKTSDECGKVRMNLMLMERNARYLFNHDIAELKYCLQVLRDKESEQYVHAQAIRMIGRMVQNDRSLRLEDRVNIANALRDARKDQALRQVADSVLKQLLDSDIPKQLKAKIRKELKQS